MLRRRSHVITAGFPLALSLIVSVPNVVVNFCQVKEEAFSLLDNEISAEFLLS